VFPFICNLYMCLNILDTSMQDEEGEGEGDEDLPPLEEDAADEGSRMEEVD